LANTMAGMSPSDPEFSKLAKQYWESAVSYRDFKKYYEMGSDGMFHLKADAPSHFKDLQIPEVLVQKAVNLDDVAIVEHSKTMKEILGKAGVESASEALDIIKEPVGKELLESAKTPLSEAA